jgi:hypothetical protein
MKKWKFALAWTGIGLAIVIAGASLLDACRTWIIGTRLKRKIASLQEAGEPICSADLVKKPIPAEQNGVTYLLRAKDDLLDFDHKSGMLPYTEADNNWLSPPTLAKMGELVDEYPRIYPLLQKTAACEDFDFQGEIAAASSESMLKALYDRMVLIRAAVRYLGECSEVSVSRGEKEKAAESAFLLLKLSRQIDRDLLIRVNYWLSAAVKGVALSWMNFVVQSGSFDEPSRTVLEKMLSTESPAEVCRKSLQSERAFAIEYLAREKTLQTNQWNEVLDIFEQSLKDISLPYREYVAGNNIIKLEGLRWEHEKSPDYFYSTTNNLRYLIQRMIRDNCKVTAQVRCLRVVNALQRKDPKDDRLPGMAELGLPAETGTDPFNGKPLAIERLPEGWKVYSVGENLVDDGGDLDNGYDVGLGPRILPIETKEKAAKPPAPAK